MDPVLYQRGSEDTIVNPNLTYDTGFTYGQGRAQCILSCWLGAQGVASGYKVALKKIPIHTISQDDIQNIPQLEQHKHLTNQNGHSKIWTPSMKDGTRAQFIPSECQPCISSWTLLGWKRLPSYDSKAAKRPTISWVSFIFPEFPWSLFYPVLEKEVRQTIHGRWKIRYLCPSFENV